MDLLADLALLAMVTLTVRCLDTPLYLGEGLGEKQIPGVQRVMTTRSPSTPQVCCQTSSQTAA